MLSKKSNDPEALNSVAELHWNNAQDKHDQTFHFVIVVVEVEVYGAGLVLLLYSRLQLWADALHKYGESQNYECSEWSSLCRRIRRFAWNEIVKEEYPQTHDHTNKYFLRS